jgi:hypothetical protein
MEVPMRIATLAVLICAATLLSGRAAARDRIPFAVRSGDRVLNGLLAEGYARSTTFRGLVDSIGKTDALVYVEAGVCAFGHLDACLLPHMTATPGTRYLRIVLTQPVRVGRRNLLIALIGHELRHALEVAERPDVLTVTSMAEMFRRIGFPLKERPGYETSAARIAGGAVLRDLETSTPSGSRELRRRADP